MRTTLVLDDDIFAFARACAQRERISIGQAVSKLVRDGIRAQASTAAVGSPTKSNFALMPMRDEVITSEHVRELMDQDGALFALSA
jgi:hypothetical protein